MEKPDVVGLAAAKEDVQLVIAQHALRPFALDKATDQIDDGRTVGTAIHQVANEDEATACGVAAVRGVSQTPQQCVKSVDFTVNIAKDVEGAVEKRAYQRRGHAGSFNVDNCRARSSRRRPGH